MHESNQKTTLTRGNRAWGTYTFVIIRASPYESVGEGGLTKGVPLYLNHPWQ